MVLEKFLEVKILPQAKLLSWRDILKKHDAEHMEGQPLSVIHDCLFGVLIANLHIRKEEKYKIFQKLLRRIWGARCCNQNMWSELHNKKLQVLIAYGKECEWFR